jgi:hypothetical protein
MPINNYFAKANKELFRKTNYFIFRATHAQSKILPMLCSLARAWRLGGRDASVFFRLYKLCFVCRLAAGRRDLVRL